MREAAGGLVYLRSFALYRIWGAWKRNQLVETVYLVTFLCCTSSLILLSSDMSGAMHTLPKAPATPVGKPLTSRTFCSVSRTASHQVATKFFELGNIFHGLQRMKRLPIFRQQVVAATSRGLKIGDEPTGAMGEITNVANEIPFIPKNETEGQEEEASSDELPPECDSKTLMSSATWA
eukprot:GHVS01003097.1.p1 GENE.GHVS01003097.1~~GHVS01003097.1.p1  ORF type:complete len:178 (-),score=12.72 GHVS01003097.1:672-1205(-)